MEKFHTEIIAEVANAHQGSPEQAVALANHAVQAGADAVKFQLYTADELLVRAHPRYEHFKNQAFAKDTWENILNDFIGRGARVYCDVFGQDSLETALACKVHGIKVHSSDLGNIPLLRQVARSGKKIFLAVGGSTVREIHTAVKIIVSQSPQRPILLHGFQSYPTKVEESCLNRLIWLNNIFGDQCDTGYMDHAAGDSPMALALPLMAMAMGAVALEKHITLDRAAKGVDYYSSLNPGEFAEFVTMVRQAEEAVSSDPESFPEAEQLYRNQVKKHWVTRNPLPAGHILTWDDLVMKRVADCPAHVVDPDKLIGRPLLRDCPQEHPVNRAEVTNTVWAVVVARLRSSRLPGKALLDAAGMPALQHLFARLKQARRIDKIMFCTTHEPEDDRLIEQADSAGISWYRGPTDDVLSRMMGAVGDSKVDLILRVTGDDILVDPDYIDRAVEHHLLMNAEYSDLKKLPSGTEVEVFDLSLLQTIQRLACDTGGTEYLTFYVTHQKDQFATNSVPVDRKHCHDWRLTLDTEEDYQVIIRFLVAMKEQGKQLSYRLDDLVEYFSAHSEVLSLNAMVRQRQAPIQVSTEINWRRLP